MTSKSILYRSFKKALQRRNLYHCLYIPSRNPFLVLEGRSVVFISSITGDV